ncbi:MAG: sodium-translocating pyrophosphatase [Persicimonas sp.]
MESWIIYAILGSGFLALVFAVFQASWIGKQDVGTERMDELSGYIREGAMAFLQKEYRVLAIFVLVVAGLLFFIYYNAAQGALDTGSLSSIDMGLVSISFIVGALCSGAAGFFGMRVATLANVRTTHAAREGLAPGLRVSFAGGAVMGMAVVGLAVLGLSVLLIFFSGYFDLSLAEAVTTAEERASYTAMLNVVTGFSLGASSIALFARVGGGIYTKAADVGGDLVGKVEAGLAEDDPRNPAAIADAVGDNVGDVAGMGADLFESYVGSIIGAMVLALAWSQGLESNSPVFLPLAIAGVGIVVSIVCTFLVRVKEGGNPSRALHTGTISAAVITAIATFFLVKWAIPADGVTLPGGAGEYGQLGPFWAVVAGLTAGTFIGLVTEYYTSDHYGPVKEIAAESEMGTAPNVIAGVGVGMISTGIPVLLIAAAIGVSYHFSGLYGIAMAALGMLATTGIQLAVDAFGPIADNAGGIAEMAELPGEVRDRTDQLDSVGNTTAAIGKGFAIGSAALTALALFTAFTQQANVPGIDVLDPQVMIGVFIGAIMPFVFSALAMKAVGRSASAMIAEVRRQFDEIDGLLEGEAKADYTRCVDISTGAALKEMIAPGLLAIIVAVIAGYWHPEVLGGVLVGVTTAGVAMAIFQSNAGGAWDNAKKYIEAGHHGGKGSDAHKASVVGDTVGDPFKDTAGPSLNILIKLMSVVALVLAPVVALPADDADEERTEVAAQTAPADIDAELDGDQEADEGDDEGDDEADG